MEDGYKTLPYAIHHDELKQQFYTEVDGHQAYVAYTVHDGALDVRHTFVPAEIGGRGIASVLVEEAFQYGLAIKLKPMATCSYAVTWLKRHPEYNGLIGADYAGEGTCAL